MTLDTLDPTIVGPALLAGLMVTVTHVPLGREVLARGIIFIDLAVAQIAGLGVIAAHFLVAEPSAIVVQTAAAGSALASAALLQFTEERWPQSQEALIGTLFVLAASGSVLLLAGNPHGGEHLRDLLVGQILWVSPAALTVAAIVYGTLLIAWYGMKRRLSGAGLYIVFAIVVTVSVQLVGVYLVFASLIIPALATRHMTSARALRWGYVIGVAGYATGILVSALFDMPTGAATVWTLALAALTVARLADSQAANRNQST
jgi:zinc/manganese transport system permease protein